MVALSRDRREVALTPAQFVGLFAKEKGQMLASISGSGSLFRRTVVTIAVTLEAEMQGKRVVTGALALVVAIAWLGLLLAQGPSLHVARRVLGSAEPILFRLSVLPTVVLALAAAVLVLPLILGGTGTMLGAREGTRVLRVCSQVGLAVSAVVVLAYGAMVLSAGGSSLGRGPTLDLAAAANLVVLQGVLSGLLARERTTDGLATA